MSSAIDIDAMPTCPVCALCGAPLTDATCGAVFQNTALPGQPCAAWCNEPDCFHADPARVALAATARTQGDAAVFFRALSARGTDRVVAGPAWWAGLQRGAA